MTKLSKEEQMAAEGTAIEKTVSVASNLKVQKMWLREHLLESLVRLTFNSLSSRTQAVRPVAWGSMLQECEVADNAVWD